MTIRTRFPNVGGYEQSRADAHALTYMPFAQPSFLRKVFQIPVSERKDSKFFKQIVAENKILTKFPLVKNGIQYPYFFNTFLSGAYINIKRKRKFFNKSFHLDQSHLLLIQLKDYILDIFHSNDTQNYCFYDREYIRNLVTQYYKDDSTKVNEMIWLVTFEVWRRKIENKIFPFNR